MEWTVNPLIAIGIGLAVLFFGYFFGLFEGRGQGYKKRQKEEREEQKNQPDPEPLLPVNPPAPADEIPVLDVSMDSAGKLRLKLDGHQADTFALDAEQRKRLIAILTLMRPWLETSKAVPPPAAPQPAPVSMPSLTPAPTPAPAPTPPAVMPEKDIDDSDAVPQSIVAQIDSILQARLAGTPLLNKGIHLQESPESGVIVWVGMDKYEGAEAVPDEEIKAAIKGAIAEWEMKYTPGL